MIKAEPKLPVTPGLYIYRVFNVGGCQPAGGRLERELPLPAAQLAEVSSTDHNEQVPVLHACGKSLRRGRWAVKMHYSFRDRAVHTDDFSAGLFSLGFSLSGSFFCCCFEGFFAFSPFARRTLFISSCRAFLVRFGVRRTRPAPGRQQGFSSHS